MRATGIRLANPAAEQAQGPPVNPVEIGNPDSACVVWKASQGGYASLVQLVGGDNRSRSTGFERGYCMRDAGSSARKRSIPSPSDCITGI
jgi:hypothetical protein